MQPERSGPYRSPSTGDERPGPPAPAPHRTRSQGEAAPDRRRGPWEWLRAGREVRFGGDRACPRAQQQDVGQRVVPQQAELAPVATSLARRIIRTACPATCCPPFVNDMATARLPNGTPGDADEGEARQHGGQNPLAVVEVRRQRPRLIGWWMRPNPAPAAQRAVTAATNKLVRRLVAAVSRRQKAPTGETMPSSTSPPDPRSRRPQGDPPHRRPLPDEGRRPLPRRSGGSCR